MTRLGQMARLGEDNSSAAAYRTDAELQRMVAEELHWDLDVPAANMDVAVSKGVVTLTGHVNTLIEKLTAQRAAHRIDGVLDVVNDLIVKYGDSPVADDKRIVIAVRSALEADSRIPSQSIQTTVNEGHVLLQGTVPNLLTRYRASQALQHISGILSVTNSIQIVSQDQALASPEAGVQEIKAALLRRMPECAEQITVEMEHNIITLSGTVRTWLEREAAFEAALHFAGIHGIDNQLRIEPSA